MADAGFTVRAMRFDHQAQSAEEALAHAQFLGDGRKTTDFSDSRQRTEAAFKLGEAFVYAILDLSDAIRDHARLSAGEHAEQLVDS
jgi:hypothetical protein